MFSIKDSMMFSDSSAQLYNESWHFFMQDSPADKVNQAAIPEGCKAVTLPHSWNFTGWSYEKIQHDHPKGVGWYFRKLQASSKYFLKFEGVSAEAEVYLNGNLIATNRGAYKTFTVSLQDAKCDGNDLIAVKVTDKASLQQLSPQGDPFAVSPRYKLWPIPMGSSIEAGGIWRNVWLCSNAVLHMDAPRVESSAKSLCVSAEVSGLLDGVSVQYVLYEPNGNVVAEAWTGCGETCELRPDNIELWKPLAVKLYRLESTLLKNGEEIQKITQPVAFFDLSVRDSEFYLNGRPYFLRGQNGFPHCNVPHDAEYIKRYVSRIKDQGVEISRFHTEPPCHAWLDECDRQGIMVIFEMAVHGSLGCYPFGHPEFQKAYVEELRALVREYRRHPSIVMWCLGNELIVSKERDAGLGKNIFDILEVWTQEVRQLDSRPVVANSGGDAAEMVQKTVGDVDDVHQYGGWYTENLFDLRNYESYVRKNDMLFQPLICTESVAAYTDNNGRFFSGHSDVRQRKVIRQRFGDPDAILPEQCMNLQAFILKEYAEAMWRMRREDTTVSGYIPFGQYTWFFDPFDKSLSGLRDKPVWEVYRKVMSPVHVQLECWNRHIFLGGSVEGNLILNHEDVNLPDNAEFDIVVLSADKELYRKTVGIRYHCQFRDSVKLDVSFLAAGRHNISIEVYCCGDKVSSNDREITVYPKEKLPDTADVVIYDPANKLEFLQHEMASVKFIDDLKDFLSTQKGEILIIGPYAYDKMVARHSAQIHNWCSRGNVCMIMEQLPNSDTQDIMGTQIGVKRSTQPYWSRWARNMVRHADRADICDTSSPIFSGISRDDMNWWNGDTYLADSYLRVNSSCSGMKVLAGIAHGLSPDELMPVEHSAQEQDYNPLMLEYECGDGIVLFNNILCGCKYAFEPVARKLFANAIAYLCGK